MLSELSAHSNAKLSKKQPVAGIDAGCLDAGVFIPRVKELNPNSVREVKE